MISVAESPLFSCPPKTLVGIGVLTENVCPDACLRRSYLQPLTTETGGSLHVNRGVVNAPWGVSTTIIPRLDAAEEDAVRAHFKLVCKYFREFEALDEPALRLVTVAGGHGN